MQSVAVIGLVLLQVSLQSCRTHHPVSLVHDASAEVTFVSPQKLPSKFTQLIPILDNLDTPNAKITKIKNLIPIYNELNKWMINNKKHLVEIMPFMEKEKPLAFILSGQPSYVEDERGDKQNGVVYNESPGSETTDSDSEELKHKTSDLHSDIHGSHSYISRTNLSQHSNLSRSLHTHKNTTPQVINNSIDHHKMVVINSKNDHFKTRGIDSNESYFDPELGYHREQNFVELLHTHNPNYEHHKKGYLGDSDSYESDINSSDKEVKQSTEPLPRHIIVPSKHVDHEGRANFYSDSNESGLDSNQSYKNPVQIFQRWPFFHLSKHAHHLENHHISSPDSISDLDSSGTAKSGISESVLDSSESESESSISVFNSEPREFYEDSSKSISDTDSLKSHLHNSKLKQFKLHARSEINESAFDSSESNQNSNNESISALFDFNSADSVDYYSESDYGPDASSEPGSDSFSDPRSNESNSESVSESRLLESNESIFESSGSISEASESTSKSSEFVSKSRESFPESSKWLESGESYLEASDSFIQSSESSGSSASISEFRESVSEPKESKSNYSASFFESSEPVSESNEIVSKSIESVSKSSKSISESSESISESKEPDLESNELDFVPSASKLELVKSNLKLSTLGSSVSLETVEVAPQLEKYFSRYHFVDDDNDESSYETACKIVGKKIETELNRGKKTYNLSFVFNK